MITSCANAVFEALRRANIDVRPEAPIHLIAGGRGKSAVYRISVPGGELIGKRCLMPIAELERRFYEVIAPALPVRSLRYYGHADDTGCYRWVFLEDSGGEYYSQSNPQHRAAAARWFAEMHVATAQMVAPDPAERSSARYLEQLRAARVTILENRCNPVLLEEDRILLSSIARKFDCIEAQWTRIEDVCNSAPLSFVHGDLQPKNLHVREESGHLHVFPLDWEHSGWGSPAVDIAYLDVAEYHHWVRHCWPGLALKHAWALARIGRLLQTIAAVEWASLSLDWPCRESAMEYIRYYEIPESIDEVLDHQR